LYNISNFFLAKDTIERDILNKDVARASLNLINNYKQKVPKNYRDIFNSNVDINKLEEKCNDILSG